MWERQWLLVLVLVTLLARIPFTGELPLVKDEALYAQMAGEYSESPGVVPTYLGNEVAWRPALFFLLYSPLVKVAEILPFSIEVAHRLPNLLFAVVNVILLYFLVVNVSGKKELGFLSALLYSVSMLSIIVDNAVLVDTMLVSFVLGAVYCYVKGGEDEGYYLVAGALSFCAFMVKTVVAFIIPVLAVAYVYFHRKGDMGNKYLLASLVFIPVALLVYASGFQNPELLFSEFGGNVKQKLVPGGLVGDVFSSVAGFLGLSVFLGGFYAVGLLREWKRNMFWLVWAAASVFPMLGGALMPWYWLPALPAFSVFGAYAVKKADWLGALMIGFVAVASIASLGGVYGSWEEGYTQRDAGEFLSDKEDVLVVGEYSPTLVFYMNYYAGGEKEFCWHVIQKGERLDDGEYVRNIVEDYSGGRKYPVNGEISNIFWDGRDFRMNCSGGEFDWVAAVGEIFFGVEGYELTASWGEDIEIYRRAEEVS